MNKFQKIKNIEQPLLTVTVVKKYLQALQNHKSWISQKEYLLIYITMVTISLEYLEIDSYSAFSFWFSKEQLIMETSPFGFEYITMKQCCQYG